MTSKKKGLSMEEKAKKVLEIFTESQDVYQLKDIEKLAPKLKGVISQSVKDVVSTLVADNLLETDKIGSSTYFWIFKAKMANNKDSRIKQLKKNITDLKKKRTDLKQLISDKSVSDEDAAARRKYSERLDKYKAKRDKLKKEVDQYKDCDPEELVKMKQQLEVAREAVERWTNNVFAIRTWIMDKTSMQESEVNKQFRIPDDFDYLDVD